MSAKEDWFTPSARRILFIIGGFELVFCIGLYVAFRWYLDLAEYALPIAALGMVFGMAGAFSAARLLSQAERDSGKPR